MGIQRTSFKLRKKTNIECLVVSTNRHFSNDGSPVHNEVCDRRRIDWRNWSVSTVLSGDRCSQYNRYDIWKYT